MNKSGGKMWVPVCLLLLGLFIGIPVLVQGLYFTFIRQGTGPADLGFLGGLIDLVIGGMFLVPLVLGFFMLKPNRIGKVVLSVVLLLVVLASGFLMCPK